MFVAVSMPNHKQYCSIAAIVDDYATKKTDTWTAVFLWMICLELVQGILIDDNATAFQGSRCTKRAKFG